MAEPTTTTTTPVQTPGVIPPTPQETVDEGGKESGAAHPDPATPATDHPPANATSSNTSPRRATVSDSSTTGSRATSPLTSPSLLATEQRNTFIYPARSRLSRDIQSAAEDDRMSATSKTTGSVCSDDASNVPDNASEKSARSASHRSFRQEDYGSLPVLIRSSSKRTVPSSPSLSRKRMASPSASSTNSGRGGDAESARHTRSLDETMAPVASFASSSSAAVALTQLAADEHQRMAIPLPSTSVLNKGTPGGSSLDSEGSYFTAHDRTSADNVVTSDTSNANSTPNAEQDPDRPSLTSAGFVHLGPRQDSSSQSVHSHGRQSIHSQSPPPGDIPTPSPSDEIPEDAIFPSSESPASRPSSSLSDEPLIVTQRFQYVTDDDGHFVVSGREGSLTQCEDEPIRTPGAVQGYGVLIAIEEDMETGNFVVRQVSENSTNILGLSPKYLFSLECFTDCLPDRDQDIFFDNIQFLNVPDAMDDNEDKTEDSTHVFVLSGFGEPHSAGPNDPESGPDDRKLWRSWCAAHRPRSVTSSTGDGPALSSDVSNSIILEFELERDTYNPLYPPSTMSDQASGTTSPGSASGSQGTRSTLSGHTLVSGHTGSTPRSFNSFAPGTSATAFSSASAQNMLSPRSPDEVQRAAPGQGMLGGTESQDGVLGLSGEDDWQPTPEHIFESTTNRARPLPALERLRQINRSLADSRAGTPASRTSGAGSTGSRARRNRQPAPPQGVGMMDIFAVMSQINEQLGAAPDLDSFLKVVVGIIKDLTQFHRVLVYQFDDQWNGQVVAELVDWHRTHDLYMGLHFPASDIPAQARELYAINKVRLLYDRDLPTARIVVRSKEDLVPPLNMTHCYLRAMSPIHIKYLGNMGVRASMSISIMGFGALWGLIACHSYGNQGMRVSFPVRQMLRLLSQSISRNIERLSYAQRLHTRKLINTVTSESHPGGYIVSNADDLLGLFDADYGMLVIGEGAKILGPSLHGQEILVVAEYLRLKQFNSMQVSQAVTVDFPDLQLSTGLEVIAGLLYVPLSSGGKDFIAFLRKGQPREVHWAGKPYKQETPDQPSLEPRVSFKAWSQIVAGRSRAWTDEQLETAGVLALVYGKFIEVWRQKESALQSTKLTNLLLSNASHEVRTPLNHIINYLELALNGPLDLETRDNLQRSHNASKSLLFTINDLLDLTRLESGNELAFNEPFNLKQAISDAAALYMNEASRRKLDFNLDLSQCPERVVGDSKKIQTVVANLTGNALKYTMEGSITVEARSFEEPHGLRDADGIAVEIVVADTGCGISSAKLESIFREFEQVESMGQTPEANNEGVGLGLAVVAHIVEQLGGQLRVDSKVGEGSRFSFLIPFATSLHSGGSSPSRSLLSANSRNGSLNGSANTGSTRSEIDSFVEALGSSSFPSTQPTVHSNAGSGHEMLTAGPSRLATMSPKDEGSRKGYFDVTGSNMPIRGVKMDEAEIDQAVSRGHVLRTPGEPSNAGSSAIPMQPSDVGAGGPKKLSAAQRAPKAKTRLRVLIVEDDDVNRMLLAKRLMLQGHEVVNTTNGQECVNKVEVDRDFDCILMDVQMPILNGFQATERVREMENDGPLDNQGHRQSHQLNGRIPIFAVSATLKEDMKDRMLTYGLDGWLLKPLDFKRLTDLMSGITDVDQRIRHKHKSGGDWERGGWLTDPVEKERDFAVEGANVA